MTNSKKPSTPSLGGPDTQVKNIKERWEEFVGPPLHEFPYAAASIAMIEFWLIVILIIVLIGTNL